MEIESEKSKIYVSSIIKADRKVRSQINRVTPNRINTFTYFINTMIIE
jgi:hypothetical protein